MFSGCCCLLLFVAVQCGVLWLFGVVCVCFVAGVVARCLLFVVRCYIVFAVCYVLFGCCCLLLNGVLVFDVCCCFVVLCFGAWRVVELVCCELS